MTGTMSARHLQSTLLLALDNDISLCSRKAYFASLSRWVQRMRALIGADLLRLYDLEWMSSVNPDDYALEQSELQPVAAVKRLREVSFSRRGTLVVWVRDQLWGLMAYETEEWCETCGGDALRALVTTVDDVRLMVLGCDLCGALRVAGGAVLSDDVRVTPALKRDLRAWGMLHDDRTQ